MPELERTMRKPAKPPVDRHQLEQLVSGLAEGVVLLDPRGSVVWANATALSAHGVASLPQLGRNAAEYAQRFRLRYRNHHALPAAQYPLRRLLRGESFGDLVVDVERRDDADFRRVLRMRGIVLSDVSDRTESLALTIDDVTERYEAEQRFERTFAANPAPALICRIADLRYVKVNAGFLEMTGYRREDVIEHSMYELDVLEGIERREEAIADVHAGRTVAQSEAMLRLPDGSAKFVIVAGQPIDVAEDACMLFTFIDLDLRKKAEDALRHSEQRFATAFRLAPVPMTLVALSPPRLLEANDAFLAATGHSAEELGGDATALAVWPEPQAFADLLAAVAGDGGVRHRELKLGDGDGGEIDCLASAGLVRIDDAPCALCVFQDISERKRSEVELVAAIEAVMQDASWFSRTVIDKLAQVRRGAPAGKGELADLTPREREVLGLLCEGHSDAEIARALRLSPHTVRNHVATIYSKIDVHRRSAAIVWARERGIVGYEPPPKRPARAPARSGRRG